MGHRGKPAEGVILRINRQKERVEGEREERLILHPETEGILVCWGKGGKGGREEDEMNDLTSNFLFFLYLNLFIFLMDILFNLFEFIAP